MEYHQMVKLFRVGVAFFLTLICVSSFVSVSTVSPAWAVDTWTQVGADFDGEAASDNSGNSVSFSSDGSRVAIGAPGNDGGGPNAGHVRVYNLTSGAWVQVGGDINGEASPDNSGYSVSLSSDGSRVAIGAPYNGGGGSYAGHVRVYNLTSGAWVQVGADIDGEAAGDQSGGSVSLSSDGSRVAIGAPENDGAGANAGHVRVYELTSGAWGKVGADIDGEAASDNSGNSVSFSSDGSRVAIGAQNNAGGGLNAGHVRVYNLTSGAWVQVGSDINGVGGATADFLGASVSLSSDGSRVAIGARSYSSAADNAGHVRVYDLTSSVWVQVGSDITGEATGDVSGWSVSLSSDGSRVAIGATDNDGAGNRAGHVRVYELSGGGGGGGGGGGITSEPRNLTASPKGSASKLTWKAPKSLNGGTITDYVIQYRVQRTTIWGTFTDGISTSLAATVTGLTKNVKYQFQVSARTSAGDSPFSKVKRAS
jgi:hypothetical protein